MCGSGEQCLPNRTPPLRRVHPEEKLMSQQSFADLGVSGAVARALADRGFAAPFAIQTKVIGDVLDGRDVLAKSPTGSGKTLAFMVPLVDSLASEAPRPAALVLAPTRELATQIVEASYPLAHARALKICAVYGGVGLQKQARDAAASHIIVATPGRLEDLLQRRAFSLKNVEILVLDEADRMLDMGFRPAVDRIVATCPRDRQTLFFSATLDGEAGRIAREYTTDAAIHEHVPPPRRAADIEHRFVRVESDGRLDALVDEIGHGHDLNLVFVRTKHGADRLVRHLKGRKVPAVAMHGNKSQNQRERALADFESGRVTTLVATDVAARGIHVDNVAKVINFDPPGLTEDYVHRTGRTGRAGETGEAVTFIGHDHVADMRKMATALKLESQFIAAAGEAPAPQHRQTQGGAQRKRTGRPGQGRARGGDQQSDQGGAPSGSGRRRRSGGSR
jgi:superfamily II DNA/RNA helicase